MADVKEWGALSGLFNGRKRSQGVALGFGWVCPLGKKRDVANESNPKKPGLRLGLPAGQSVATLC